MADWDDWGAPKPKPKPKRITPRTKPICPEPGSLYDILHSHAGTSLYVLPICWTSMHTRLLGCRFVQMPAQTSPTPSTPLSPRRCREIPPTVIDISRNLDSVLSTDGSRSIYIKNKALRGVLSTLFPNHLSNPEMYADLDLRFGRKYYPRAVRCQTIWTHPEASAMSFNSASTWTASHSASQLLASMTVDMVADTPMLAFVSRSHLNHVRRNCFRVLSGPNRTFNAPVHRLQTLRSKNLIPRNIDEDQYFIAITIAMAQKSVYGDMYRGTAFNPKDTKVRVLTVSEDESAFVVYTATVPATLLAMFDRPDQAPTGDMDFKLEYKQVPIWPVLGLKERLARALGKDIVGDFPANDSMETYEHELAPAHHESTSPKRRREVLSEVFNASFSEDRDPDSPALGKRRCIEGRVGVVR
ncbi:hypothetical protein F5Y15DRAFT_60166 [Xylariaceae sp. FL0016]|nr:hypothetical protein F5Y15DRAFT_60166 [Xylariaceae sp. FL0016]